MMMVGTLRNRYNAKSSVSLAKSFWKELRKYIISDIKLNVLRALKILIGGAYSKKISKRKVDTKTKNNSDGPNRGKTAIAIKNYNYRKY